MIWRTYQTYVIVIAIFYSTWFIMPFQAVASVPEGVAPEDEHALLRRPNLEFWPQKPADSDGFVLVEICCNDFDRKPSPFLSPDALSLKPASWGWKNQMDLFFFKPGQSFFPIALRLSVSRWVDFGDSAETCRHQSQVVLKYHCIQYSCIHVFARTMVIPKQMIELDFGFHLFWDHVLERE